MALTSQLLGKIKGHVTRSVGCAFDEPSADRDKERQRDVNFVAQNFDGAQQKRDRTNATGGFIAIANA